MNIIKYLIIKGGGVLIAAEIGALLALYELGLLTNVVGIGGTSAGSILASLFAVGYTPQEIKDMLDATNFSTFEDNFNPFRLLTKYGMYNGDVFQKWIEAKIKAKLGKDNATFRDLRAASGKDLLIFASCMNTKNIWKFSYDTDPDAIISGAARCSMSIPEIFKAFKPTAGVMKGKLFQDGGIMDNYAIDAFDQKDSTGKCTCSNETLGIFLYDVAGGAQVEDLDYNHPKKAILATWDMLMEAQDVELFQNESDFNRSIIVDSKGISATNFKITPASAQELCQSGQDSVPAFLAKHPEWKTAA